MLQLTVNLEGDGAWPDLIEKEFIHAREGSSIQVAPLDGGMASGLPSVTIRIDLSDGKVLVAETSARLFVMAADIIAAKYPKVRG